LANIKLTALNVRAIFKQFSGVSGKASFIQDIPVYRAVQPG